MLIVTDVAARGIDIPILDNVIMYDFAPSPKVWYCVLCVFAKDKDIA